MTPCLQPDEFVDCADGVPSEAQAAHLAACASCRAAAAEVQAALADATRAEVPEPPSYFWASVNHRVHGAIAALPPVHNGWRAWLAWDTLVPLAGMATLLVALGAAVTRAPSRVVLAPPPIGAPAVAAPEALVEPSDDALALVVELAATLPDTGREALGVGPLPDLGDVAVTALSDDELQALESILRTAVDRPKS